MAKQKRDDAASKTEVVAVSTPKPETVVENNNETVEVATPQVATHSSGRITLDPLDRTSPLKEFRERYADDVHALLVEAFDNGFLRREEREIEISSDKSGTGQAEYQPYFAYIPTGKVGTLPSGYEMDRAAGMALLSHGKFETRTEWPKDRKVTEDNAAEKEADERKGAVDHFDHGMDLTVRSLVRTFLSAQIAGPIVEITRSIRIMLSSKVAKSKQQAYNMVLAARQENGEPIPEGITIDKVKLTK